MSARSSALVPEGARLFDRALLRQRRRRAARGLAAHAFLLERASTDMAERIADLDRRFDAVLLQGVWGQPFERLLGTHPIAGPRLGRIVISGTDAEPCHVIGDEEALPFAPESFEAALSLLTLHWTNDLPGALIQLRRCLKPDGLFIGTLFGGDTLIELRQALGEAEIEIEGGLSPRVSPFLDMQDGAGLLQRAGFALPVADRDRVAVSYETPLHLMNEIRGMGEANLLIERRRTPMKRALLARALDIYTQRFSRPDGRVSATFDILTLTGWAPHERQQKPLRPGSATARLADVLGTVERKPDQ